MANIGEMLIASGLQSSTQAPDISGSIEKGAQLGLAIQNMQTQRQQLEQKKAEIENSKFEKVGQWLDNYSKMPEGPAKKAFGGTFIPNGIGALGLSDKIHPDIIKMSTGDPVFSAFLVSNVRQGELSVSDLNNPDKVGDLYAKYGQQFGDEQKFKDTISESNPALLKAEADALSSEEKDSRARTIANAKEGQRTITNLSDLRREVTGHPITKDTISKADSYDKIRIAFGGKPSAAADISGVFAYMKLLDPQSTVREGEQAQARNAAGVPEVVMNVYNRLLTGESLTPKQRADFLNQAERQYASQYEKQMALNKEYEAIAKATGIDKNLIFAGTKFKAPPKKKSSNDELFDIGGQKMTKAQAKSFYEANPQFKPDEATKKKLGM